MTRVTMGSSGFGREVVLGLVIERPSSNCYQLDQRLEERFGSAEYARGMARQTIGRLEGDGLVCVSDANEHIVSGGTRREGSIRYVATQAGVEHFAAWMWASVSTPPVREELHAKIALCQPVDLPRMIDVVREAEIVCAGRLQALNRRVQSRRANVSMENMGDWLMRMDLVVSTGDQAWWDSRIKWLQQVRVYLEEEWQRCRMTLGSRTVLPRMM